MQIGVIGTGYVGLVTGTCLADCGHEVACVDIDDRKIRALRQGIIPIYEPGLEDMLWSSSEAGRLEFTTSMEEAVDHAEILMIAVGTPPDEDGSADLSHVLAVASEVGR